VQFHKATQPDQSFFLASLLSALAPLSHEAADLPEQQDAFFPASAVFPASADLPAQHAAALLSQDPFLLSFALPVDAVLLLSAVFVPFKATFFTDWAPSFVETVFSVADLDEVVEASVWALTANAKNANTLRIRTFFIDGMVKVFR